MKHTATWSKRCANCKQSREADLYHASRYSADGLTGICRICQGEVTETGSVKAGTAVCACGRKLMSIGAVNCGRILCREGAI